MEKITRYGWLFWLVELGMVSVVSYNFWLSASFWGIDSGNPTIVAGAIIIAGTTEIALFAFLHRLRQAIYMKEKHWTPIFFWGFLTIGGVAISLYVNHLYYATASYQSPGDKDINLWVRSGWPMILLIGAGMVNPKAFNIRPVAEIKAEYASKLTEEEEKQKLKDLKARGQFKRIGIMLGSEARRQQRHEEEKHRREREERRVEHQRLRQRGIELGLIPPDFNGVLDFQWLKDQIKLRELPFPEQLDRPSRRRATVRMEREEDGEYYDAKQIADMVGWKERRVRRHMASNYDGRLPIEVSRKKRSDGTRLVSAKALGAFMAALNLDPNHGASDPEMAIVSVREEVPQMAAVGAPTVTQEAPRSSRTLTLRPLDAPDTDGEDDD